MFVNPIEAQIRLYAKQLKVPTFADYRETLRRMKANSKFEDILLEIMVSEYQRQVAHFQASVPGSLSDERVAQILVDEQTLFAIFVGICRLK